MIIIKTNDSDIIVNEAEIYSLIYKREENVISVDFKDGSRSTKTDVINVKTYPGTPDMTFVNNVEPEPEPELKPEKKPINQVTVLEIGRLMDEMEEEEVLNREKDKKGGLFIRFVNVCRFSGVNINTLEDLLKMGKADFRRLRNIGPQVITLLDKVLETKYGITKW